MTEDTPGIKRHLILLARLKYVCDLAQERGWPQSESVDRSIKYHEGEITRLRAQL